MGWVSNTVVVETLFYLGRKVQLTQFTTSLR